MLFALNRATNRISTRSRSIHEQFYHPVIADFSITMRCHRGRCISAKRSISRGHGATLERGFFDHVEARAANPGGGPPHSFSLWQNARVERFVGTVEAAEFDEQRGDRRVTFNMPNTEGALRLGDLVFNLSAKHAEGIITAIFGTDDPAHTTQIGHTPLRGGTRDQFEAGDQIRITSPHSSGHAIIIAPTPTCTDEQGDESLAAFVARRHRIITRTEMDNENDSLELDDEFNDTLMYEILHWARVQRTGLDTTAQLYRRLSNEEYLTAIPLVENRISQRLNTWERGLLASKGYRVVTVKDTTQSGFHTTTIA